MAGVGAFTKRVVQHRDVPASISTKTWLQELVHDPVAHFTTYLLSLFPILGWIRRYNLGWAAGDVIAGITVGIVVVPQSMSYAIIATLPPQYGLYSSFVGVMIYCLFATSKDVTIGPVAVMSLTVASIISAVQSDHPNQWDSPLIATTLSFLCGFIVLGIGLLRIGWIVEFIPIVAISAFMTGSAINIAVGQVAGLLGISGVNTRGVTYQVIIDTLKALPGAGLDASFGIVGIFFLYAIRYTCNKLTLRYPRKARLLFFINIMRNGFVIIVLTFAAWLFVRSHTSKTGKTPIKVLGNVPAGFQYVQRFVPDSGLVSALAGHLPLATIVLLLEHIAIARSFGRINGYKIDPNQELIAIGVTNTVGTVFHAYPATGSFSRSAIKSKSGVRTPLAGIITGLVVIVALYGVTPAFQYIPTAGLSAIIIHAVGDLIASPAQVYSFWRVSPLEFFIWWGGLFGTIFGSIEIGIYTTVAASLVLLLIRVAHPRDGFLGKVTLHRSTQDGGGTREVFVPLKPPTGVNTVSHVDVRLPAPGVIVYRHEDGLLYPNTSASYTHIIDYVKEHNKRGRDMTNVKASDRPWNDPGPTSAGAARDQEINIEKPDLRAIVFDFSGVSHLDTTAVQSLVDLRTEVEKWADHSVEFHFATILSPWIRRALIAGGFGTGPSISGQSSYSEFRKRFNPLADHEGGVPYSYVGESIPRQADADATRRVQGPGHLDVSTLDPELQTPFFHIDLIEAVRYAEEGAGLELSAQQVATDDISVHSSGKLSISDDKA